MILDDLKKIVEMQNDMNLQFDNDYLNKHYNWDIAIITKLAELIESTNYKLTWYNWWKKSDIDYNNIKDKCINILHYLISDFIQFGFDKNEDLNSIKNTISEISLCKFIKNDNFANDINDKSESLIQIIFRKDIGFKDYIKFATIIFLNLANSCNIDLDEILPMYITESALNKLRNAFGNKYKKFWSDNGQLVEDNIVAYKLIRNSTITNINDALKLLQDYYLTNS